MTKNFVKYFLASCLILCGTSEMSAAIPSGYTLSPGNNETVTKIETITLTKSNEYYLDAYVNRNIIVNGEVIPLDQEANLAGTKITMNLKTPVTKNGTYNLVIPAGNFTYGYPEIDNPEISWTVIVFNPDQQEEELSYTVSPEGGSTVKSVETVSIDFTGASAVTFNPDVEGSNVKFGGKDYDTVLSFLKGESASSVNVILSNPIQNNGNCTLLLAEGLFTVTIDGEQKASPEIKISYNVDAPLGIGDSFMAGKLKYKITSLSPAEVAVTWTSNEADYNGISTVPTSVENDGVTYAVTSIGELAFSFVMGLKNFVVPEGIVSIEKWAFTESSLETIQLPSSLKRLGMGVFDVCESLTEITFPDSVEEMEEDMLSGCVKLQKVVLPKNITKIPDNFMAGCISVPSVTIPETVTEIGEFAFSECEILTGLELPENIRTLKQYCFSSTINITELDIPETVDEIGKGLFYRGGLLKASLPDNYSVLPNAIFAACTGIESFVVGNKIEEIEDMAFYWCFGLKEITLGEKLAKIGARVFDGDDKLEKVICLNPVPASGASFEETVYQNASLYVPTGSIDAYRNAEGWKNFRSIQETSGIESAISDMESAAPEYFNLQGVRISQPEKGALVIEKSGNETKRKIFK